MRVQLLGLALNLVYPCNALWPFPPKRFSGNSLVGAGPMGLDDKDGRVVAFGYFDGDQFLDVLSLGQDERTLSVYLWSHEEFKFKHGASFKHPNPVRNVVPGDFTHNGKLDLLVMSQSSNPNQLDLSLYLGKPEGGFEKSTASIPPSSLSQPIPIDTNGDMKIDLLGTTPGQTAFKAWVNTYDGQSNTPIFNIVDPTFHGTQCTLSNPHSNAVVDLNGDCLADLFLVCDGPNKEKTFQIWVNNKGQGFSLAQQGSLPSGTQSISFADMNRDGTLDMVFPTCASVSSSTGIGSDCYINIAYNQQIPLCAAATKGTRANQCRPPEELCTADPNFKFDLTDSPDNLNLFRMPVVDVPVSSSGLTTSSLLIMDNTHSPPLPVAIRLGDANLDGFPDLALILSYPGQGGKVPKLLFTAPCGGVDVFGCRSDGAGRGFTVAAHGVEYLDAIRDARSVAFLDMDEDGTLDIMVQRTGEEGQGKITFVQNNFYYDAFFLKAIVLNGACGNGFCTPENTTQKSHPFGASYSGATFKYTVLDTSNHRSAAQVGQLPQTGYHSLLTPYSFFGLGRTNNYIENLFVGSTKHADQHFINMEGVIPNSKVVILPPQGDGTWKQELFLRPGEWIPWVTLTVVVGTILLAVIVSVLHLNEKREDELERRRISHHINFDAL